MSAIPSARKIALVYSIGTVLAYLRGIGEIGFHGLGLVNRREVPGLIEALVSRSALPIHLLR